jgi:hypothetical protein
MLLSVRIVNTGRDFRADAAIASTVAIDLQVVFFSAIIPFYSWPLWDYVRTMSTRVFQLLKGIVISSWAIY